MKFKEMNLAHFYCQGEGVEIGAAAHNSFGLKNCINIAPKEDEEFYKQAQIDMCGEYIQIDAYGDASNLPVEDYSKDYIISSHVVEHIPNLIGAFREWNRVLKKNGIIFMVFPKRDALPSDVGRAVSSLAKFDFAYKNTACDVNVHEHVWVFTLESMINLIEHCNEKYNLGWEILETEQTDSKAGNGHTVVCEKL